tara:strand:- start:688 stop:1074 length:387 start_codon:yes stop_codon:yes gene_type:complete
MHMKNSSSRPVNAAKWSFVVWLSLVALGIILIIVGFEDPGEPDKGQPLGGLLAIFGDIQFNFPEQFMMLLGLGFLCLNLAWVVSFVAAIVSVIGLRSSSRRKLLVTVLVISLLYVALGAWFWIGSALS